MQSILRLLGLSHPVPERTAPPRIPTDTVIPVPYFDNLAVYRHIIPGLIWRFDDVLDGEKLHNALERLIARPSWRRLGGRLRKTPGSEALEFHVPKEFSKKRPAVTYTQAHFDKPMTEHPVLSQVPKYDQIGSASPPQYTALDDLNAFTRAVFSAEQATQLSDYLYSDLPLLSLHVAHFSDGTVVSLAWQHVLSDAMGMKSLVDGWLLVLAGRDDEVLELADGEDGQTQLGLTPAPKSHLLRRKWLHGWRSYCQTTLLNWSGYFWRKQGRAQFILCIPDWCVQRLRREAMSSTSSIGTAMTDGKKQPNASFLSGNDLISAFLVAISARRSSATSTRNYTIGNVFSLRKRLPDLFDTSRYAYVRNITFSIWTFISVAQITQGLKSVTKQSLFATARALRGDIVQQTTRDFIEGHAAVERMSRGPDGSGGAGYGDATSMPIVVTSWAAADFFTDVDFAPAVVRRATDDKEVAKGKPSFFFGYPANPMPDLGHLQTFNILGADARGNHWIVGLVDGITDRTVEEALRIWTE